MVEPLEPRWLLAAASFGYEPTSLTLVCGAGSGPVATFEQIVTVNKKPTANDPFDAVLKSSNIPDGVTVTTSKPNLHFGSPDPFPDTDSWFVSFIVDPAVPEGSYSNIRIKATAVGSNVSESHGTKVSLVIERPGCANRPPDLVNPGNQTVSESNAQGAASVLAFDLIATDPDPGQTLTYSISAGAQPGMILDPGTGAFSWSPSEIQDGSFPVTFQVCDDIIPSLCDSESIVVTVNEVNEPPVFASFPTLYSVVKTTELEFVITAVDPDLVFDSNSSTYLPNTLDYHLESAPAGATISKDSNTTALVSWTPTEDQGPADFPFSVHVEDQVGASDSESVTVTTLAAGVVAGNLVVVGTSSAESVSVDASDPNNVTVFIDGESIGAFVIPTGGRVLVEGFSGDDTVVVLGGVDTDVHLGDGDNVAFVVPNSTINVTAGSGSNTIDFSFANFGITFDLGTTGGVQDVAPIDDPGKHFISIDGNFSTLVGSNFSDALTATSGATVLAGVGNDLLYVNGHTSGAQLFGGADADSLMISGTEITAINFQGDTGADQLTVTNGTVSGIEFGGGADGDALLISNGTINGINFAGDSGIDGLQIDSGIVTDITFGGGADGDALLINDGTVTGIDFTGDSGSDGLQINSGVVTDITFGGGADGDFLTLNGGDVTTINFQGDTGADQLTVTNGTVSGIEFGGGADADALLINDGTVTGIDFTGDSGSDGLQINGGVVTDITFGGGADGDFLTLNGGDVTTINFQGDTGADQLTVTNGTVSGIEFGGGADGDALLVSDGTITGINFAGDSGIDGLQIDSGIVTDITFGGGADGDALLINDGTVTGINFTGDSGTDGLQINSGVVTDITFGGGADGDFLTLNGGDVTTINFQGDTGADQLTVTNGTVSGIEFGGGADGDALLINDGTVTGINFTGDSGTDGLQINSGVVTDITFGGGADGDFLTVGGGEVTTINFQGDTGADQLTVTNGTVSGIVFGGGADGDALLVTDGTVTGIDFNGDSGIDGLQIDSGVVTDITFAGGADGDFLTVGGGEVTTINFQGDTGADQLTVTNGAVSGIEFGGGADSDSLLINDGTVTEINFLGDSAADSLQVNNGTVASITFGGGADGDALIVNDGAVTGLNFAGDSGADSLTVHNGTVSDIIFTGDLDSDAVVVVGGSIDGMTFQGGLGTDFLVVDESAEVVAGLFSGDAGDDTATIGGDFSGTLAGDEGSDAIVFFGQADVDVVIAEYLATGSDTSADRVDFSSYDAGPVTFDLASTAPQQVAATLRITLVDALGLEDVVGTAFADWLSGNDRNNRLQGADQADDRFEAGADWDGVTQVIVLDFDSETDPATEHVYTPAERDAIQSRLEADFSAFHVEFVKVPPSSGQYAELFFNKDAPDFGASGQTGGYADEIDFRNLNLGGTASIQVNGILGAPGQPEETSANIEALSAKIAAHETGHLMGLTHQAAFGPHGFGIHNPPGSDEYLPSYPGPVAAFETFDHLMSSPATVGSSRHNDVENDLFFGERSAVMLAFSESGVAGDEQAAPHRTPATAQVVTPEALDVPNTLVSGLNDAKQFAVAAFDLVGEIAIDPATSRSENDFYAIEGREGDLLNIMAMSTILLSPLITDPAHPRFGWAPIDAVVRVYDGNGILLVENDDQFEPTDSSIVDLILPADGTYIIEVDTFTLVGDPSFADRCLDANGDVLPTDPCQDTGTGDYELFAYRFDTFNPSDAGDEISGGGGNDVVSGALGADTLSGGAGNDTIDGGPGIDLLVEASDSDFTLTNIALAGDGTDSLVSIERAQITGGQGDNVIDAHAFSGEVTLNGLAGDDTLLAGSGNDTLTGDLGSDTIDGGGGYDQLIESADVDFLLTDSQLSGVGGDSLANIEAARLTGGASANVLDASGFSGAATLLGMAGDDMLKGGSGDDHLDGGAGDDHLGGASGNDILLGGTGDDHVGGGSGFDLAIAGLGADRVVESSGDDLVIGGSTAYDANDDALQAILDEWNSGDDYEIRVGRLRTGTGTAGGVALNATTVFADGDLDKLTGSSGRDWFFIDGDDEITDLKPDEFLN